MSRKSELRELRAQVAALETKSAGTLAEPDARLWEIFGLGLNVSTAAGEPVGPSSAMRVPAVAAAIRAISETLASLDMKVMHLDAGGLRREDHDHSANRILARPNPWTSRYSFVLQMAQDACRHGIGGAVAVRAGGELRELIRIHPGNLGPQFNPDTGEPSFRVGGRTYGWRDVVSIMPVPTDNGEVISLVSLCREAIGFSAILQKHGSRLFANGGKPGGILSVKGDSGPQKLKNIHAAWMAAHGHGNSGGTAILPGELEFAQLALSSVDQQYLELWKLAVLEVARTFRVPPILIGDLGQATFNNSEELGKQFVALCIKPWCELLSAAFEQVLFTDDERGEYFIEFDFAELLKPSTIQLYDALYKAATTFMTPDEARSVIGLGQVPGGAHLRVPGNTVRADAPAPEVPAAEPVPDTADTFIPRIPRAVA